MNASTGAGPGGFDGRTLLIYGVVVEGFLVVLAWVLWVVAGPGEAFDLSRRLGPVAAVWPGLGLGAGLAVVVLALRGLLPALREAVDPVVRAVFGPAGFAPLVVLSLLAGFAEELLFRGVVQELWGLVVAALLFGLSHWGGRRELTVYGLVALGLGLALGWSYQATGHLLLPMVGHTVYNIIMGAALHLGAFGRW